MNVMQRSPSARIAPAWCLLALSSGAAFAACGGGKDTGAGEQPVQRGPARAGGGGAGAGGKAGGGHGGSGGLGGASGAGGSGSLANGERGGELPP